MVPENFEFISDFENNHGKENNESLLTTFLMLQMHYVSISRFRPPTTQPVFNNY